EYEHLKGPIAQGDGPLWVSGKNPSVSQFSVYGSAHVGIFGGIIRGTSDKAILQLNLLKTDFYHEKAFPSYLYYNPYPVDKTITIQVKEKGPIDLYNTVTGQFIARNKMSTARIRIPAKQAVVILFVPSGGKITHEGQKMLVNGIVTDYHVSVNSQ
ncbi:MAG TPA: hypothetical protein VFC34_06490, partial [Puia sp.]|nr:hypothetical protein [Puia sp.]